MTFYRSDVDFSFALYFSLLLLLLFLCTVDAPFCSRCPLPLQFLMTFLNEITAVSQQQRRLLRWRSAWGLPACVCVYVCVRACEGLTSVKLAHPVSFCFCGPLLSCSCSVAATVAPLTSPPPSLAHSFVYASSPLARSEAIEICIYWSHECSVTLALPILLWMQAGRQHQQL